MSQTSSPQALDGVRVLDFTQMMLGPLRTQTFADLGADVVKVERPGKGEWMRGMPMFGEFVGRDSAAFHSFNRNKKSIAVDLKYAEGRALLLEIVKDFDVVTENFAVLNQDIALQRSDAGIASCWNDAPYGPRPTSDGYVAIAMCPLDKLGELLGDPDLASMHAFDERDAVKLRIDALTSQKSTEELLAILQGADVWRAPVRTTREALDELQVMNSDRLIELDHPEAGKVTAIACPITLTETPVTRREAAPLVGQHTDEVLDSLIEPERKHALRDGGAIQ